MASFYLFIFITLYKSNRQCGAKSRECIFHGEIRRLSPSEILLVCGGKETGGEKRRQPATGSAGAIINPRAQSVG